MHTKLYRAASLLVFSSLFFSACAAEKRVTGVPTTYLTDVDTTKKIEKLPFEHSWVWADMRERDYHAIYIAPIDISTLPSDAWETNASSVITSEQDYLVESGLIAKYFRQSLIDNFKKPENKRLPVVDQPGPGVLTLNIALTELEFSHPAARAAAMVAPIPGTSAALSTVTDPHVAFAARLTDGATGQLIATAADRKFAPLRIIDLNKLTVTSSAREIVANWADMLADSLASGGDKEVENKGRYALLPW